MLHLVTTSPLLFETDRNRVGTIRAVLARTSSDNERDFLIHNEQRLGIRCEALLAGEAVEWFETQDFLSDADRNTLGMLARDALAEIAV